MAPSGAIEVIYLRASNKRRRQGEPAEGPPRKRGGAHPWPGGLLNKYLRFVLHKENLDTQVPPPLPTPSSRPAPWLSFLSP